GRSRSEGARCARLGGVCAEPREPRLAGRGLRLNRGFPGERRAARLLPGAPQLFCPELVPAALGEHLRVAYVGHAFLLQEFSRRTSSAPFPTARAPVPGLP